MRLQLGARRAPHLIACYKLLVAALVALPILTQSTAGYQQVAAGEQAINNAGDQSSAAVVDGRQQGAPIAMAMSESESSAVNSDDLLAAESSQAPDAPGISGDQQHKAFTSGQMMRQVSILIKGFFCEKVVYSII